MKRLALCILSAIICLGFATITQAQQAASARKQSSQQWPQKVCKTVEQYFAGIDAARSTTNKAEREKKYAAAKQSLVAVLEPLGRISLIEELAEYQALTESIINANPSSPAFPGLVDKRLKVRNSILNHCLELLPGL